MTDTKTQVASAGTAPCNESQVPLGYLHEEFHVSELLETQMVFSDSFSGPSVQSDFSPF